MLLHITPGSRFKKLIVIGDRVLIKLSKPDERTASGLYLPPSVQERLVCRQAGKKYSRDILLKRAPGYVLPMPIEDEKRSM